MKITRNILVGLAVILFFVPGIGAQDLSKYRTFSLGTSLADLAKQVYQHPADADVIQRSPAMIQELLWRPFNEFDPVDKVVFSFYDGKLYKIVVAYSNSATEGLTAEDMVQAISAKYGVAAPVGESSAPASLGYRAAESPIAKWEDVQYSVTLSRVTFLNGFQLVMFTKQMEDQADAAIIQAARQAREDAPGKEVARVKKEADDLQTTRLKNVQAFRP
jgi:hypothetical protein